MQVLKPRAALLSNYEVLTHFRTLHSENTSIASAISSERARRDAQKADFDRYGFDKDGKVDLKGKGREKAGMDVDVEAPVLELKTPEEEAREKEMAFRGLADELVFTTEQVVKYLSNPSLVPTVRQSSHSIAKLIKQLTDPAKAYGLTKAEVLGCVNLGPTKLVELFMIVEECEDRLTGDQMQEIIDLVAASLLPDPTQNGEGDESFYGENGYDHAEEGAGAEEDEEEYMMNWQEGGQGGEDFYAENKWGKEADEGDGAIDE